MNDGRLVSRINWFMDTATSRTRALRLAGRVQRGENERRVRAGEETRTTRDRSSKAQQGEVRRE